MIPSTTVPTPVPQSLGCDAIDPMGVAPLAPLRRAYLHEAELQRALYAMGVVAMTGGSACDAAQLQSTGRALLQLLPLARRVELHAAWAAYRAAIREGRLGRPPAMPDQAP